MGDFNHGNTYVGVVSLFLSRLNESEDVNSLCTAGAHQVHVICTEGQAVDLNESEEQHGEGDKGGDDGTTRRLVSEETRDKFLHVNINLHSLVPRPQEKQLDNFCKFKLLLLLPEI